MTFDQERIQLVSLQMNMEINNNKVVFFILKTANYINNNNKIILISLTSFFSRYILSLLWNLLCHRL